MKTTKSILWMLLVVMTMTTACSDDDDVKVSMRAVAGYWDYSEVLVDQTWMDVKRANRSGSLLLTEDGYYGYGYTPYKYKVNGNTVELYDEDGKTVITLVRFTSLDGNSAEITRTVVSSGKSEQIRLRRSTTVDSHVWRNPNNYLPGTTWTGGAEGHEYTAKFLYGSVTITQGDITYTGQFARTHNNIYNISIYNSVNVHGSPSDYWGLRNPDFVINRLELDAEPPYMQIVGASDGKYRNSHFSLTRK